LNVPRFLRRIFRSPFDGLRHFAAVENGALYRCGQPTAAQLDELITRYGLKTVIALRGNREHDDPDGWEARERAVCDARGVHFVTLPCNHKNPPTADQVGQFLSLVRDARCLPALVHCRIGQQRTGLFCALYRVHVQGIPAEAALREMDELGFDIRHRRHQRLLSAFRELSRPGFVVQS
jgi:uncharacterized protein (TIGR01244 family)